MEGVRIGQKDPFESSVFFDIHQITQMFSTSFHDQFKAQYQIV